MKKEYIKTGKCIWCLNGQPKVSFYNKPHTISRQLGATNIGFDICDSCNTYFGIRNSSEKYPMGVELAFKEVFNVIRYLLSFHETNGRLRSIYFEYYKKTRVFRIKKSFKYRRDFMVMFTRQFKRGIYETFLQEYHLNTENGHDSRFDKIREFARNDRFDIPLYFIDHDGAIMLPSVDSPIELGFNKHVTSKIDDYGFYSMFLFGFWFYLEVTPRAELSREIFLQKESRKMNMPNPIASGIKELNYITDLDFTLKKIK